MNICVTGGAGFIGSHLVDRLIAEGHRVQVIDNLRSGDEKFIHPQAEFVKFDVRDPSLQELWHTFKPDYVFHEAAQTVVSESMADPYTDCDINLLGLVNVLNACRSTGVKKILVPSSAAVYGNLQTLPLMEEMTGEPASFYGLTKLTTEKYLKLYYEAFGLPYICYRYANVYGPRQGNGGEGGVVSVFSKALVEGKPFTVFGDGLQTRDFVYVDDVVNANLLGLEKESAVGVYNVSTEIRTSLRDLICAFQAVADTSIDVIYESPKLGDIKHSELSMERIHNELGFVPHISLQEGIRRTVSYFKGL